MYRKSFKLTGLSFLLLVVDLTLDILLLRVSKFSEQFQVLPDLPETVFDLKASVDRVCTVCAGLKKNVNAFPVINIFNLSIYMISWNPN